MTTRKTELLEIEVSKIVAGTNVRSQIETNGLVDSVEKHGLLQPILVRPAGTDGKFEIVAGARRLEAAKRAGLSRITALVRYDIDEKTRVVHQIVENVQREQLTPLDEATAYGRYLQLTGDSTLQLANLVGKSQAHISNMLAIFRGLSQDEKNTLRSLKEQPSATVLWTAARTRNPKLRAAMIEGQFGVVEAIEAKRMESRRGRGGGKGFVFHVQLSGCKVMLLFKAPRVTKGEAMKALKMAETAVAESKRFGQLRIGRRT